ncbi:hypothetical protein H0H81_003694 [Sphagnurus paluster]|uniref:Uncharacterized protein n=1 Tax=Sphagnurus paluster TaxID=117069 RepID=A0A9P7KI79_9AGAR|nr:hypothetical protein H0H81_003694 [Sphagnurus paluster]
MGPEAPKKQARYFKDPRHLDDPKVTHSKRAGVNGRDRGELGEATPLGEIDHVDGGACELDDNRERKKQDRVADAGVECRTEDNNDTQE